MIGAILVLLTAAFFAAKAHDDAAWIQAEPRYRMASGTSHCCSKDHCHVVKAGEVERVAGGWLVVETGQVFEDDQPFGLYESIDVQMWQCSFPANWVCLFTPQTAG